MVRNVTDTWTRFLAFSCPHCPLQDDEAVEWLGEKIREHKPHVIVHLGDGHEADSASRWPTEYTWALSDEFRAHNALLARIRKWAGRKTRLVFLPGNHDDNMLAINRIDRKLRDLCDYREHEPELVHWEHRRFRYENNPVNSIFRVGQVTCAHGWAANAAAGEFEAYRLGVPFGLYVHGHTHRPNDGAPVRAMRTKRQALPWWYANAGTMRDMDTHYMQRKNKDEWGQAVVLGAADPNAGPAKHPCYSPKWWARTDVFRYFNDFKASKK